MPASLEFVGAFPPQPRIGETTTLQFLARDGRGEPAAGVEVVFSFAGGGDPAGVTLSPRTALSNRGSGVVEVQVTSTRVQSVIVVATAGSVDEEGNGEIRTAQSPPITFAGEGSPSGRSMTFQCGEVAGNASGGAHAIMAYDDTRHLIAGVKLNCIAHVADRNGDGVPGAVVSFLTEAGHIGPSATSSADVVGNASTLYKTALPLPKDVAPGNFVLNPPAADSLTMPTLLAPLWMHPFDWNQNPVLDYGVPDPSMQEPRRIDPIRGTLNNPRDNLVTMIAITRGEEGFTDVNNNGQFDTGEPFDDLTEPFVDSNDNGTKDDDELWVDTDGDGVWDGKNNAHDADTNIWVSERILWTGVPHPRDYDDAVTPVFRQVTTAPVVGHLGFAPVELLVSDPWFNSLAQNGGGDGCSADTDDIVGVSPTRFGGGWVGVALTYPSPTLFKFFVVDGHEDTDAPYPSPLFFTLVIGCQFTGSPVEPFILDLPIYISGSVQ
ncbi:MAG: hypothetical protein M3Y59_13680 [Myxococcota bacterium]|nr:hypothetical protein [Myxococcota bacterium]